MGERPLRMRKVAGSTPVCSTYFKVFREEHLVIPSPLSLVHGYHLLQPFREVITTIGRC